MSRQSLKQSAWLGSSFGTGALGFSCARASGERKRISKTLHNALHNRPAKGGERGRIGETEIKGDREKQCIHGSDVHQGGDGPLMRAALFGHRIPMMELLVPRGADVNALWNGYFPVLFAPCETVEPAPLKWLLDRGADPNCPAQRPKSRHGARLRHKQLGPFTRAWRLHRYSSRGRWHE